MVPAGNKAKSLSSVNHTTKKFIIIFILYIQICLSEGADYVHASVKVLNEDHFECRCQTYTVIEVTGWSGASCCHIRFINEMLPLCEFTIYLHYAEWKVLNLQSKCGIKLFCCDKLWCRVCDYLQYWKFK